MKGKVIALIIALVLVSGLLGGFLWYRSKADLLAFAVVTKDSGKDAAQKEEVKHHVVSVTLTYSNDKTGEAYTFSVAENRMNLKEGTSDRTFDLAQEDMERLDEVVQRAIPWYGFLGKGEGEEKESYYLTFAFDNAVEMGSRGTNSFPEGYREFMDDIEAILDKYRNQ